MNFQNGLKFIATQDKYMKNTILSLLILSACLFICCLHAKENTDIDQQSLLGRLLITGSDLTNRVEVNTNGILCILKIDNKSTWSSQSPPICKVSISHNLPYALRCWSGIYFEKYTKIELLDSIGVPVNKTDAGKQIGKLTNKKQILQMIHARYIEWLSGKVRVPGFVSIKPGQSLDKEFSIPNLFRISKPGLYTLIVQTCLIKHTEGDANDPKIELIWLPEVRMNFNLELKSQP